MPDERENKPTVTEMLSDSIYREYFDQVRELNKDSEKGIFFGTQMRMPVISSGGAISSRFLLVIEDDPHMHHLYKERKNNSHPHETYCGKAIAAPDTRTKKGHCPACSENWYKEKGYAFPWGKY